LSQGVKNPKVDRVIELFREKKLYSQLNKIAALCIELILQTGATPIDIVNIKAKDINKQTKQLTLHVNKKKQIATTTHHISSQAIKTFFELNVKKPLSSFSVRRLQQIIKKETEKIGSSFTNPRSLRRAYLKKIFQENPTELRAKTQLTSLKQRHLLSKENQQKLIGEKYSTRNKTLILTLLHTGIRISELLHLQAHHIKKNVLTINKKIAHNNEIRKINIPSKLVAQYPVEGYLFANNRNDKLTQRRFEQICKEVGTQLNIKQLSPSIIRASAIQNLSKLLGEKQLLIQTGLQSSTLYTHAIFTSTKESTSTTTTLLEDKLIERKDSDSTNANEFMYSKSKLKDGGDIDE